MRIVANMSNAPHLIGLVGGPGAGKDTAASLLTLHHGFRPVAFADGLRNFLYATDDGWRTALDVYGYEAAKDLVDGFRDRMIEVGNAAREHISPDVWVMAAEDRIELLRDEGFSVVVSDVRYRNEAAMIRDRGGVILGIDRPGHKPETIEAFGVFCSADDYVCNHGNVLDLWAELDALLTD